MRGVTQLQNWGLVTHLPPIDGVERPPPIRWPLRVLRSKIKQNLTDLDRNCNHMLYCNIKDYLKLLPSISTRISEYIQEVKIPSSIPSRPLKTLICVGPCN